jgi:hypothetical protein
MPIARGEMAGMRLLDKHDRALRLGGYVRVSRMGRRKEQDDSFRATDLQEADIYGEAKKRGMKSSGPEHS